MPSKATRFYNQAQRWARIAWFTCAATLAAAGTLAANSPAGSTSTNIFAPISTPADQLYHLSLFDLSVCAGIFIVVFTLLVYAVVKFRRRADDDGREPPQIYGSDQLELAWTVIPILIVVVLFLTSARVIHTVEDAREPANALKVTVVAHRYWWEYRYPQYGFVTANELHVPVSSPQHPWPTFLTLLSADTDHGWWVPRLAGKTDLIPNHVNTTWIDPHRAGLYLGQCSQFCGTAHAMMLIRVYVQTPADFGAWVQEQKEDAVNNPSVAAGRRVFESTACINCHAVRGTVADGRFGPDLTHLMSRQTLGSGIISNTPEELQRWILDPSAIKPGVQMPAMNLSTQQLDELVAYLGTLR
jgi:cytochrome c oxidase subunit II